MKRIALVLASCLPLAAFAANNTVTFKGQVATQTCAVSINGNANSPVVLLPTVNAASLADVGSTAGETPFTLELTGCNASDKDQPIKIRFAGHGLTNAGNLGNTGDAAGVQVQLMQKPGGAAVVLSSPAEIEGPVLHANETSASHEFAVRYISEEGGAQPGTVSASADYTVDYL